MENLQLSWANPLLNASSFYLFFLYLPIQFILQLILPISLMALTAMLRYSLIRTCRHRLCLFLIFSIPLLSVHPPAQSPTCKAAVVNYLQLSSYCCSLFGILYVWNWIVALAHVPMNITISIYLSLVSIISFHLLIFIKGLILLEFL